MTVHGYTLTTDWKNSNCGQTAIGVKAGRQYFLKKYQVPVNPVNNGSLDQKTFDKNKKRFDRYVAYRIGINKKLREISGMGGNIVAPADEFVYENHYVEASELVEGVVSDDTLDSLLATLPISTKELAMMTAAGALHSVHSVGMVHSDLKPKNLMLAKNAMGNYVAKLIDFDASYFVADIPHGDVLGDPNFYSPELAVYLDTEDESEYERNEKLLSVKSDIFSLGLIYHYYLSNGKMPEQIKLTPALQKRKDKGRKIYTWIVLNNGCEIRIDDAITDIKYRALLYDMLEKDPALRPTAAQVLKTIKSPAPASVYEEAFSSHGIVPDTAALRRSYYSFRRASDGNTYVLRTKDGRGVRMTKEELLEQGLAKKGTDGCAEYDTTKTTETVSAGFDTPYPEHDIVIDEAYMRGRGFIGMKKAVLAGKNGYDLLKADGSKLFFTYDKLLMLRYAKKKTLGGAGAVKPDPSPGKTDESCIDTPWPEHAIRFDAEKIKARGFVSVKRYTSNGINGYIFSMHDGQQRFMPEQTVLILKMAVRV